MQIKQTPVTCLCEEADRGALNQAIAEISAHRPGQPGDLIPLLQTVQRRIGYLPEEALLEIARTTRVPAATVFGVATFYAQFRLSPQGRHAIRICTGTACHVRGSHRILQSVKSRLNVETGGTTEDRMFTLETVSCFGACALAPVVVVDASVNGRMGSSRSLEIIERLKKEAQITQDSTEKETPS
jgi:NADH-quinone oxidoreductase subunit E